MHFSLAQTMFVRHAGTMESNKAICKAALETATEWDAMVPTAGQFIRDRVTEAIYASYSPAAMQELLTSVHPQVAAGWQQK
jgi:hypothetical protein